MSDGLDIFQEWRVADRAAHTAEQRAMRDAMASLEADVPASTVEARDSAHRLRGIANDLFVVAMSELKRRSEELRR